MADSWLSSYGLPGDLGAPEPPPETPRRSWWSRHWANPSFSGSLIAVTAVLLVVTAGLWIGAATLHVSLADIGSTVGDLLGG